MPASTSLGRHQTHWYAKAARLWPERHPRNFDPGPHYELDTYGWTFSIDSAMYLSLSRFPSPSVLSQPSFLCDLPAMRLMNEYFAAVCSTWRHSLGSWSARRQLVSVPALTKFRLPSFICCNAAAKHLSWTYTHNVCRNGVDATGKPWTCMTGLRQSPINVPPSNLLGK